MVKKRTPPWIKKLFYHPKVDAFFVRLAAYYIRLVYHTTRWEWQIPPTTQALLESHTSVIFSFWHGRLIMMPYLWPRGSGTMRVLISEHKDGMFISRICKCFGIDTVHGSSSKRSLSAVRDLLKALKSGESITFTPDGPRGPRFSVAPGVVAVAQKAGAPIIPWIFSSNRGKSLKSWDRFFVPYPFGKGCFIADDPLFIPPEMPIEEASTLLKDRMMAIMEVADRQTGLL